MIVALHLQFSKDEKPKDIESAHPPTRTLSPPLEDGTSAIPLSRTGPGSLNRTISGPQRTTTDGRTRRASTAKSVEAGFSPEFEFNDLALGQSGSSMVNGGERSKRTLSGGSVGLGLGVGLRDDRRAIRRQGSGMSVHSAVVEVEEEEERAREADRYR